MEACEEKVKLIRAGREDAKLLWNMQLQSFAQLLERYNDMDTNPGNEPLEKTVMRLKQPFTYFYFIEFNSETVGALRVVDKKNGTNKKISPIFILPAYRNRGIAQMAILCAEELHGKAGWELDTILEEKGNCFLYEKMGYRATGEMKRINEKMTLVYYEK